MAPTLKVARESVNAVTVAVESPQGIRVMLAVGIDGELYIEAYDWRGRQLAFSSLLGQPIDDRRPASHKHPELVITLARTEDQPTMEDVGTQS